MTVALIDGDIVAFRASVAAQADIPWDGTNTELTVNPEQAAEAALQTIQTWARLAKCKTAIVCFTGRNNFRKTVLPTYKANRAGKVKPVAYVHTVQAVTDRYPTRLVDGLEADDLLGIMLTTPETYSDAICITIDKDLRTVPGRHFNPTKQNKPDVVGEEAGRYFWLLQTLHGDTTDGYSGIPGVGPKKAVDILGPVGSSLEAQWARVVAAYQTKKLTEADALVMARVARILQRPDYDKQNKVIQLWHPKQPVPLLLATVCA